VQAAFRTLSADHQAVLSLFAVEGLKHGEIAGVLGIPEGTVWYRLHEARKALRERATL
jgi:RNA polymerase sigma-70 factor (ECF subfamily)